MRSTHKLSANTMAQAPFTPSSGLTPRLLRVVLVGISLLVVVACSDDQTLGKAPNDGGHIFTVSEALQLTNYDRTITVRGDIALVCQDEGCWMSITDGKKYIRMTFADQAFTVPISAEGAVLVEGVIHEELVDAETAQAMGSSIGADSATDDVGGDRRIPLMTASGVKFLD